MSTTSIRLPDELKARVEIDTVFVLAVRGQLEAGEEDF